MTSKYTLGLFRCANECITVNGLFTDGEETVRNWLFFGFALTWNSCETGRKKHFDSSSKLSKIKVMFGRLCPFLNIGMSIRKTVTTFQCCQLFFGSHFQPVWAHSVSQKLCDRKYDRRVFIFSFWCLPDIVPSICLLSKKNNLRRTRSLRWRPNVAT